MNKKELINSIKKYLLALPAIIISILFFIIPFILLIFVSFTEKSSFFFTPKITLANFYKAFTLYRFDYQNTLFLSASAAFLDVVF
jgi:ABC-type sugar transport system permease subunit